MTVLAVYPRAFLEISAIVGGSEVVTGIEPSKLTLTVRPHTQADTLEATFHGSALPYDPRFIESIFVTAYIGAVDSVGARVNEERYVRFMGYVDRGTIKRAKTPEITMQARDLSSLLRDTKVIPTAAVPRYSDTLRGAIERVLGAVPGAALLTLLDTDALSQAPELGSLVHARVRSAGAVPLKANGSVWDAIEHVCGIAGRRVTVRLDQLLVQSPAAAYTNDDEAAATFIFGSENANALEVEFDKKFLRNRKGIKVVGFDPNQRRRVEAVFPPDSELPRRQRARPRGKRSAPDPPERDIVPVGDGAWEPEALLRIAQAVYEERSRQELEGTVSTPIWDNDVLNLKNGARIAVQLQPDLAAEVRGTDDDQAAIALLRRRLGVSDEAAQLLVNAARQNTTSLYHVRNVKHDFNAEGITQTSVDFLGLTDVVLETSA